MKSILFTWFFFVQNKKDRLPKEVIVHQMENETISSSEDTSTANLITFVLLVIVEIPALICTLPILLFFFSHWHSMITKALHNHAIFLLIIVSFLYMTLDLPFSISSYHLNYDIFRTPSFCLWWYWIDYTLLSTSLFLTATASIQRHILIFNSHCLRIRGTRWLLHFLPLLLCILYPASFYIGFIYVYPCETVFDEESLMCPSPCYSNNFILNNIDWGVNYICPVFLIVLANIVLIFRVIYSMQKLRRRHSNNWKRQRKLTLQLLSFSLLYIFGWGPTACISIIQMFFLPNLFDDNPQLYYLNNSSYFVCPLQSFICIFALPELMNFIKNRTRQTRVVPAVTVFTLHEIHV